MDNRNKRRAGMYWVGDEPYISVTEILKSINKPSIQYWYGQQVYYATVKNPSIDERSALAAPYTISRGAASRGSTIHSIVEAYKHSGNIIDTVPEEYRGYARAFYHWVNEIKPEFLESEKTVINETYKYAGTLDLLARIGGKTYVIDFKTSKDGTVYSEAHLQVSAYRECVESDGGVIVGLAENETYNHQLAADGFKPFISTLNLYSFLNRDKLIKLGWKGDYGN